MNHLDIIRQTKNYVKDICSVECSGHDWWHIHRVYKLSVFIAKKEKANLFICKMASLLHDLDDWKFNTTNSCKAEKWLKTIKIEQKTAETICEIISQISFKGAGYLDEPLSKEAKVVQDADRLDAIGAIGIARAFAYGGYSNRLLFDPSVKPVLHKNFKEYQNAQSHTINHFYEKLLLLKDRMHTQTAREIAEKRHHFLEYFLKTFYEEWFFDEKNPFVQK